MYTLFVHDKIYNSVADYKSSRVGVGCQMSDDPFFFLLHDGITFERFELQGWNFVWGLDMEISSKNEPMETISTTPTTLPPSETVAMG